MTKARIAILTDIHAAPADWPAGGFHDVFEPARGASLARAAVDEMRRHEFDAVVVLGDLTNNGDDDSFAAALNEIARLDAPTWVVAGNHDLRVSDDGLAQALTRSPGAIQLPTLAGAPLRDEVIVAGLQFRGLTDALVELAEAPDGDIWSDRLVVLLSHYPIDSRRQAALDAGWKYAGDPRGLDGLAGTLASRPAPTVALHGHLHLRDAVAHGSYLQLGFSGLIENGHHVAILEIETRDAGVEVTITTIPTSGDARPAAAIGQPSTTWSFANGVWSS